MFTGGLRECNSMGLSPSTATRTSLECLAALVNILWILAHAPHFQITIGSTSLGTIRSARRSSLPSDKGIAQLVQVTWSTCEGPRGPPSHRAGGQRSRNYGER
eukprot:4859696-Pyramimonas_sp.AAC.1